MAPKFFAVLRHERFFGGFIPRSLVSSLKLLCYVVLNFSHKIARNRLAAKKYHVFERKLLKKTVTLGNNSIVDANAAKKNC